MKQTVVIGGVKYAPATELPESNKPYCIIRCHDAGVHAGFLEHRDGREVTLTHSRRLWRWWGETLSGLAINGSFAPEKCNQVLRSHTNAKRIKEINRLLNNRPLLRRHPARRLPDERRCTTSRNNRTYAPRPDPRRTPRVFAGR